MCVCVCVCVCDPCTTQAIFTQQPNSHGYKRCELSDFSGEWPRKPISTIDNPTRLNHKLHTHIHMCVSERPGHTNIITQPVIHSQRIKDRQRPNLTRDCSRKWIVRKAPVGRSHKEQPSNNYFFGLYLRTGCVANKRTQTDSHRHQICQLE